MFEFRLPDIGEGIAEGEVVTWHVAPGQQVNEDQDMVEVMTDKATVCIGSPRKGRIAQLNAAVGERVKVGSVLVVIDTSDASEVEALHRESKPGRVPAASSADSERARFAASSARGGYSPPGAKRERALRPVRDDEHVESKASSPLEAPKAVTASAVGDLRESLPGSTFFQRPAEKHGAEAAIRKPLATPATRKLARDLGVDLRQVEASGKHGRITNDDVRSSGTRKPALGPDETRTPFVGLRRRIAERMQLSVHKAAHFTFVEEAHVDRLQEVIARLHGAPELLDLKLHYLPFVVKAATLALAKHPVLNSMLDEETSELVYRRSCHIGVATATEQGLVVPVVRDADQKSVLQIARDIQRLAEGARLGKLSARELTGSTFTITSLGKLGGLLATPVLNYPEVGILGVHRVKERPVVRDGQIVIGHVMNLSLSFDHRIVDGHVGAAFAYELIHYLEQPELLLLQLS